jgi:hypothetical protein
MHLLRKTLSKVINLNMILKIILKPEKTAQILAFYLNKTIYLIFKIDRQTMNKTLIIK